LKNDGEAYILECAKKYVVKIATARKQLLFRYKRCSYLRRSQVTFSKNFYVDFLKITATIIAEIMMALIISNGPGIDSLKRS